LDTVKTHVRDRPIGVLINNAGFGRKGPFTATATQEYLDIIAVNASAPVVLCNHFLPAMLERNRGVVIHVASINALAPVPSSAVYSASKSFILYYASAVAYENRHKNVTFQIVLPGTTATEFHVKQGTKTLRNVLTARAVVRDSLDSLGAGPICVSGALYQAINAVAGFFPLNVRARIASKILRINLGVEES
jgi:short-subunit dehydrogenase